MRKFDRSGLKSLFLNLYWYFRTLNKNQKTGKIQPRICGNLRGRNNLILFLGLLSAILAFIAAMLSLIAAALKLLYHLLLLLKVLGIIG